MDRESKHTPAVWNKLALIEVAPGRFDICAAISHGRLGPLAVKAITGRPNAKMKTVNLTLEEAIRNGDILEKGFQGMEQTRGREKRKSRKFV